MPVFSCPVSSCEYKTEDVDTTLAVALLTLHNHEHMTRSATSEDSGNKQKPPKLERPRIAKESSEETWNMFRTRWSMFVRGTAMTSEETVQQLFECCSEDLGDDILRGHPNSVSGSEQELLNVIKKLAVLPVAVSVRRTELIGTKQQHGEGVRSYLARLTGKAATCAYSHKCPSDTCDKTLNFTDIIVKDVLVAGLADDDVKKDVLGWADLDAKSIEETINFIEAKEMARDALTKYSVTAAVSTYKTKSNDKAASSKINCKDCDKLTNKFVWSKNAKKWIECSQCINCWRKIGRKRHHQPTHNNHSPKDESNAAIVIGSMESPHQGKPLCTASKVKQKQELILDHYIFNDSGEWRKSESMSHPTLKLQVTIEKSDYDRLGIDCPHITPSHVTVVTDTGAQSCLWGTTDFLRCGFRKSDLLPVRRTMVAANQDEIRLDGAIFIRLVGKDCDGNAHTAPVMVYISPDTKRFYLSREALVQLRVIPKAFPQIGAVFETMAVTDQKAECGCPARSLPPKRPNQLPFPCTPQNNERMKEWLIERYASSTFNKCPHQPLKGMTGPEIKIHVDPNAKPVACQTPAMVPGHWYEKVENSIRRDLDLGVLEKPPLGEPQTWVHRMVVAEKEDGSIRRMVDLSPLNKHCVREVHHVRPPFQQARAIPRNTWKTVTDAWNGYHSVPIRKEDRHLTTFITPWGRFRYKVAPQGFVASGDGYSRRFDEVIIDVERKTKCVDDTVLWDTELADHWWRTIDFIELLGNNGIILNKEKFQFAKREINFAGFCITDSEIKPHEKFVKAIADFPTPTKVTDVRSWFGLVHQVGNYGQLSSIMMPFKKLLSPKVKFFWDADLNEAFEKSKQSIVTAITKGVEIYDFSRKTCLRPDWSTVGVGFFLSQKHCDCESSVPGCCNDGWRVTMAGSRFLKPCESRYAAVEGEALAIQWALEQTKYFTLGCKDLVVVTDHKPLVKLFGDRTLDEISNTRLFRLKQKTLMWRFSVHHMPGKSNHGADAMSRNPVDKDDPSISNAEVLAGLFNRSTNDIGNSPEETMSVCTSTINAVTWQRVREATDNDPAIRVLRSMAETVFPDEKLEMPVELRDYWPFRESLYVIEGVVVKDNNFSLPPKQDTGSLPLGFEYQGGRVLIPAALREEVLQSLHAAHQGITSMNERAKASVFWPGITQDIQRVRARCKDCNRIAPSQAKMPPLEPLIPTTPFEAVACDYFHYMGYYYLVCADRLSGWTEQIKIKVGSSEAGASGLCKALRRLFATFGVPLEISSDGGPEFVAKQTEEFLKRWGVHHRISSVSLPSSNGRAELAVKSTKRLLMSNIGPSGDLDTDNMVQALLTQRNTPDPGCRMSPAQIIFGRPLRDTLPYWSHRGDTFSDPRISRSWKDAWRLKEQALKARYVQTMETLNEHSRTLTPLKIGDSVFIQNQTGQFPNKWDRSGTIMEVKDHNQYVVKVAGTGRLTLRNRRFLRKFIPHLQSAVPKSAVPNNSCADTCPIPLGSRSQQNVSPPHPSLASRVDPSQVQGGDLSVTDTCSTGSQNDLEGPESLSTSSDHINITPREAPVNSKSKGVRMLTNLAGYNNPGAKDNSAELHTEQLTSDTIRRSSRARKQTKLYDASTGN